MSINMNGHNVTNVAIPQTDKLTYSANVEYIVQQTKVHGMDTLSGYTQTINNYSDQATALQTKMSTELIKLDGSSLLTGNINGNTSYPTSISGVSTPLSTQVDNAANVTFVHDAMTPLTNQVNSNKTEIANFTTTIPALQNSLSSKVKLDGSSLLQGNISVSSVSGLATPSSTQVNDVANVAYTTQLYNSSGSLLPEAPCVSYSSKTTQILKPGDYAVFETTTLAYKSTNADSFYQVNTNNISFNQVGVFYFFVSFTNITSTIALMELQVLYTVNTTNYLLGSLVNSPNSHNIACYVPIQQDNIVTGSAPVKLQVLASLGTTGDTIQFTEMSWFIVLPNLYGT